MTRCYNPKAINWEYYGGRGIKVHPSWRQSFQAFIADVGRAPSDRHTIDRVETDGNYEPGNVRWATAKEQRGNQRPKKDRKQ